MDKTSKTAIFRLIKFNRKLNFSISPGILKMHVLVQMGMHCQQGKSVNTHSATVAQQDALARLVV